MADTDTINYGYVKPEVGASDDTWGGKLNGNWDKLDAQMKALEDKFYPVGSIFLAAVGTNPATLLGFGTWVAYAGGRALVGVGTADEVSWSLGQNRGEANVTLTSGQVPSHSHSANPAAVNGNTGNTNISHSHSIDPPAANTGNAGSHSHIITVNNTTITHDHGIGQRARLWVNEGTSGSVTSVLQSNSGNYGTDNTGNADANHKHNASAANSGNHSHSINIAAFNSGNGGPNHSHSFSVDIPAFNTGSSGGGGAHTNIQPSVGVQAWRRTA